MSSNPDDTIFALSSGAGRSAIAVIRMSGPAVRTAVMAMVGTLPQPRHARLCVIREPSSGRALDQALVLFFPGPHSETGEDIAEFQVHGGRAVVASVLAALAGITGLRPAGPGEFAQRALRNGKMDLLDVEALADLIDAETELQRRQAIEGGGLVLRDRVERWREGLLDILADLEAQIDFSDEGDVTDHIDSQSQRLIKDLKADMRLVLLEGTRGERLREGFRVVLMGAPNAGKSSLLNALAARDVAIVSDQPGTTRDRIEIALDLNGVPVLITDTAGLQETTDVIEREGIRRSMGAASSADLILWLCASDQPVLPASELTDLHGRGRLRIVQTKLDLSATRKPVSADVWCQISVTSTDGLQDLFARIEVEARRSFGGDEPALLTRARHQHAVIRAHDTLERIADQTPIELVAEEIRLSCRALDQLVGRIDVEDVLGAIFSRFCIGK